jgi:tagatose-1,6-bisphosphate aldolase non-catalytic subunit AgaZ/GatZ
MKSSAAGPRSCVKLPRVRIEAVFALAVFESEWIGRRKEIVTSNVAETLEQAMLADPQYWKDYYPGDETAQRIARKYSLSDRARYYWSQEDVAGALEKLLAKFCHRHGGTHGVSDDCTAGKSPITLP